MENKKYLLIPIIRSPYSRIGPEKWQDWYRQIERTIEIAKELQNKGGDVTVTLLSNFQPKGKPSEIEVYTDVFKKLAPELHVNSYRETNNTSEQVEKSFQLAKQSDSQLIFISVAWLHYPRVLYHAAGRKAVHYAVFGIPHPIFAIGDITSLIIEPVVDLFGLTNRFEKAIDHEREQGKIL